VVSVSPDGDVWVDSAAGRTTTPAQEVANPYKGLEAFHEADADRFFGREVVVDRLWERCRQFTTQSSDSSPLRLLPVIGPSGCGKSSVVRAGLLPELARRPLPGLGNSRVAILVPGSHPVEALAAVLARMDTGERLPAAKQKEIIDALMARDPDGGYHGLRRVARFLTGEGRPMIIVVDQFEEVWSLCNSTEERAAFIAGLLDVAEDRDARVSVVFTLRSDFLTATSAYPALSDAISRRGFLVPSMTAAELRSAIAEPARRAGFSFDDATIELMVRETEGREGALPLLEFALTRIWEGLRVNVPAAQTLRELGGVGGALAKEAERLYQQLPAADQRIIRRAFLAQVRLGEGSSDSRRRALVQEIVAKGEDPGHVLELLRDFSQPGQRFITLGGDQSQGMITVELSHEALLENWGTLKEWIRDSREDLRFQRRLEEAVEEWHNNKEPSGLLWRSPALDLLRAFHQRRASDMTPLQIAFFEQSERHRLQERRRRYAIAGSIFGLVLVTALVFFRQNYINWVEERPWGRLVRLSTGKSYPLRHETANVGRSAEGVTMVNHQVALPEQRISRIHLGISRQGFVADWRSFYGTTVNAKWLKYGQEVQLEDGDILALAGLEALRYQKLTWKPWNYLGRVEFEPEPPAQSWALLIDGKRKTTRAIQSAEAFVTPLRDGTIGLSDQPSEEAILAIRRRVFQGHFGLTARHVQARKFPHESEVAVGYDVGVLGQAIDCRDEDELPVLTFQVLPAAKNHLTSSIKEKAQDYDVREIVMPSDAEVVFVLEAESELHGLGEIIFTTDAGPFQIIPLDASDVGEIGSACAK
jgi:hypothetical protein